MANIDTYYRLNATAPLSESLLERIARVRQLSRAAKTHVEKKQIALRLENGSKKTRSRQRIASER